MQPFGTVLFTIYLTVWISTVLKDRNRKFSLHRWQDFPSLRNMATLRNKRKLAAVSRETPESTRNGRAPNVLDPELTQDYISQVSEEIEGRFTKKLSKEFSRTESRILGALSKLDEFLLNPQVRTCSVVAPGTSRSSNLVNQGTNEDRPSDDPGPEVEFSSPISGAETNPHMVTGEKCVNTNTWQWKPKKRFPTAPPVLRQGNRRRRAQQVNLNFAVEIPPDTWGRPDFVGPSTIGDELQHSQFQQQY